MGSFRSNDPSIICSQQSIHTFFPHRLHGSTRFHYLYDEGHPSFLQLAAREAMSLDDFLDYPPVINGQSHRSLRYHSNRASRVLDPDKVGGLGSPPIALRFGDGHGGNIMISSAGSPLSMLYVDYEVAGHHIPFLDLAKPIYQDEFFNIAYADLLYDNPAVGSHRKEVIVRWRDDAGSIHIDYHFDIKPSRRHQARISA
jgi:hypothetical protein